MKKLLITIIVSVLAAQTFAQVTGDERERLKEEIRKEIEEERNRAALETELRQEVLEDEKRAKADSIKEVESQRAIEIARLKELKKQQNKKWRGPSISVLAGVSIPIGYYSAIGRFTGEGNALTGFNGTLGFTWYFFKYFGVGVTGGFTHNPFNSEGFAEAVKPSATAIVDVNARGHYIYDARLDFDIRIPFQKARFSIVPFAGVTFVTPSNYRVIIVDGNDTELINRSLGTYANVVLGLDLTGEYYLSEHSGVLLSAGFQYSSVTITSDFLYEPFEVIYVNPRVGYRYRF